MKEKTILLFLMTVCFVANLYSQLVYINEINDYVYYEDYTFIPKYNLSIFEDFTVKKGDSLFFNDRLVPDIYINVHFDIYNERYFFITFLDSVQISEMTGSPYSARRKDVYIIDMFDLKSIYSLNLNNCFLVESKETVSNGLIYQYLGNFYAIKTIDLKRNIIYLFNENHQTDTFYLKKERNLLIK